MFDRVHTGDRCDQTKAFKRLLEDVVPGSAVTALKHPELRDYQVLTLTAGTFLTVTAGVFQGIGAERNPGVPLLSHRGDLLDPDAYLTQPPEDESVSFDLDVAEDEFPLPDDADEMVQVQKLGRALTLRAGAAAAELIAEQESRRLRHLGRPDRCHVCGTLVAAGL